MDESRRAAVGQSVPVSDPWAPGSARADRGPRRWTVVAAPILGAGGVAAQASREMGSVGPALLLGSAAIAISGAAARARSVRGIARRVPIAAAATLAVVLVGWGRRLVGGRQAVLTVVGVALASLALDGVDDALPDGAAMATAVPLLAAAQVTWFRLAPQPVTVGLLVGATAAIALALRWPERSRGIERRLVRALRSAGQVLAAPVVLVVSTLCLYLPGLVVRAGTALAAGRRRPVTGWEARSQMDGGDVRTATRMFGPTPAALRRRRSRRGAVVVVVASLVATALVWSRFHGRPAPSEIGTVGRSQAGLGAAPHSPAGHTVLTLDEVLRYSDLPAYRGVSWADALQRAQGSGEENPYFNVDEHGDRRTLAAPTCRCKSLTVWFSGGSAAFGLGQRDDHTIASDLVRLGARNGLSIHVVNISRDGAVIGEEEANIERRLQSTPAPDLVVLYDGWNDTLLSVADRFRQEDAGGGEDYTTFTGYLNNINDHADAFLASTWGDEVGRQVADHYRTPRHRLDVLAATRGIRTAYFFQPDALTSRTQLSGYQRLTGITAQRFMDSPLAEAAETASTELADEVHDLRHLFDDATSPVFLGLVHQNEQGAAAVASAIFDAELDTFRSLAR